MLVVLWKQQMQPEVCRQLYDLAERLSRSVGSKVSAVSMIQHTEGAPSAEARDALNSLHEDPKGVMHRVAVVFPRTGFIAATMRSILLGMAQRASRRAGPSVFGTLGEALTWAGEGLPGALVLQASAAAVARELESLPLSVPPPSATRPRG